MISLLHTQTAGSMGLRDIESSLPPGFRFYPNDEELVCHYLCRKVRSTEGAVEGTMVEVDLHTHDPWELPDVARLNANEWYFFSFRDRKYATGSRSNRASKSGYWKATGKDRMVCDPSTRGVVGLRKTLVFYRGRAPNGIKSSWVMHEFRLENPHSPPKEDWVLCRVMHRRKGEEQETKIGSSPPLIGDQPLSLQSYREISSSPCNAPNQENNNNNSNSSRFIDDDESNLPQCSFHDFTPQLEIESCGGDELGLFLDVGPSWQT
ncbi:uncharacterized protein A4U43_C04F1000 [Asparagus officinalis]|uniref:NAC domain-containing protein n=1 Tax=Asparagus officinalis TaxID=4686 RepID=A0A5P1EXE6_ASPOF|nr:NAC domain-containing protein 21/22-like [Asparagus officinalis]ONK70736.1 uncharacterized protein A4U43_C04F1000 [Asparagus officinalis]